MNYIELLSIVVTVIGAVFASYIKLKDQIAETQNESRVSKALIDQALTDVHTMKRDIHNLALMLQTRRALAEEGIEDIKPRKPLRRPKR
jgi:hypothetical protein